jgi:noggin
MSITIERGVMLITWLLLVMSSWFDTGSARSFPKPSLQKIPLKEVEDPIWRKPPGKLFGNAGSGPPQVPSPLDADPKKLRTIIKKFEPRYMSIVKPDENTTEEQTFTRREIFARMPAELKNLHFTVPGTERELGGRASKKLRLWLWNLTSCKALPLWKDFGPTIWPRYVNIGQCQGKKTCSYPAGMQCKPAKYKRIYTLFWVCSEQFRKRNGTKCIWVPYPTDVIEKCKCSC